MAPWLLLFVHLSSRLTFSSPPSRPSRPPRPRPPRPRPPSSFLLLFLPFRIFILNVFEMYRNVQGGGGASARPKRRYGGGGGGIYSDIGMGVGAGDTGGVRIFNDPFDNDFPNLFDDENLD